jgi:spore coat protein U domain-containing protein, fimbrial subunit CupE1/2/3/6
MRSKPFLLALVAGLWMTVGAARSARAANCSFQTVTSVSFGTYDVFSLVHLDTTATFSYKCSPPVTTPVLYLSAGGAGSFNPRRMSGPVGTTAQYNLYLDSSRATIWGDGTGGSSYITAPDPVSASQLFTYTIYARVFAGQDLVAGAYSDSVTITINF